MRRGSEQPGANAFFRSGNASIVQAHECLLCHIIGHVRFTGQPMAIAEEAGIQLVECRFKVHADQSPRAFGLGAPTGAHM